MLFFDGPVQVSVGGLATTPHLPTLSLLIEARLAQRTTPVQRAYMHCQKHEIVESWVETL